MRQITVTVHPECIQRENEQQKNKQGVDFLRVLLILCLVLWERSVFSASLKQFDFELFLLIIYGSLTFISENQRIHFLLPTSLIAIVTEILKTRSLSVLLSLPILVQKYAELGLLSNTQHKMGKKSHKILIRWNQTRSGLL